ncbi:Ferrous iron transport protein B [hydrothermal vent metagenome]|uniref:Ferrous iron transport protein B n=1 Tax=hydrothermal vent metagenome TaxID=652676 RepID=A0A3B1E5Y0_9ZZZZ
MKNIQIAIVGQPNVGKSMLANSMGKTTLHVGNFAGVTVEKKEIEFKYKDYTISMVDLPGTYMLTDYSTEERITSEFLKDEKYDIILNVVDSTNLERNLQLTSELLILDKKMIIVLNMSDEAEKENIKINSNYMSELLGVDVIRVSAITKNGIDHLLSTIIKTYSQNRQKPKLIFSEVIEEEIANITSFLKINKYKIDISYRKVAIDLIAKNKYIYRQLHDDPIWIALQPVVLEAINHIKIHHDEDTMCDIMADEFMAFNRGIIAETTITNKIDNKKITTTKKIDNILIHPLLGIPIFLFLMWGLFQLTFEIGSIPMHYIDALFNSLKNNIGASIANNDLRSLVVDGLISGVGAVVLFIPNIMILFIGIALLESTGYMSRIAYLLDGFFHKFGMHGQSFIPLVTGFGCSVPAYMSARILKNNTDRLLTLFIIGFMSCGARLPVYVLFVGAFFSPQNSGNILFIIYISGVFLGLVMAKILKVTVFKGKSEPFVMEMPKYRMPSLALVWHTVSSKTMMYLKKAGTFIATASILVWFTSNYPQNLSISNSYATKIENAIDDKKIQLENELNEKLLEQSYLGQVGKLIEPIFEPIGMDWKMAVALQTGLAAKEVVVSTLGVLYSLSEDMDEKNNSLAQRLHDNISFATAVAFIIIIMVYLPCLAATIVFAREAGGWKYAGYLFILTSIIAYTLAFIAYNLSLIF